jgi:phosphoserine phosphatase
VANGRLTIYLVRHGVTPWNRENRMQGHTDIGLDPAGYLQAEAVGRRIAEMLSPPQAVYCSDLSRARDTAMGIAAPLGLSLNIDSRLRETCLGDWEGLTAEEIIARGQGDLLQKYREDAYQNRPPNAETMDSVWNRMLEAYHAICQAHSTDDAAVAIVGHGGSLRALLCQAMGAPITSMKHLWLSNASISIIECTPPIRPSANGMPFQKITLLNDTGHLPADLAT